MTRRGRWEHFAHAADMGVRGIGPTKDEAFAQAALALTAVIADPAGVAPKVAVTIECQAPDDELLFADWLNAIIYEMATRKDAVQPLRGATRGRPAHGHRLGRAHRSRAAPSGGRGQGRRPIPRCAWRATQPAKWCAQTVVDVADMDTALFIRHFEYEWEIAPHGAMRVPAVIYASEQLIRDMDQKVYEQAVNVAMLPGIVKASYAMPDAHWGYGFPIGGVAAFDPDAGGVISAGGVGFDISRGVRCLLTGLTRDDILPVQQALAEALYRKIPAGVGSTGTLRPERGRDGRHARRRRALGRRTGLRHRRRSRSYRGARPDAARQARQRLGPCQEAPARRNGHARFGQSLSRGAARNRDLRCPHRAGVRIAPRRRGHQHPLRLARARAPDRHRVPEANGGSPPRATASSSPTASWRARRSTRPWARTTLGAMARRHQLRARQPPDSHASGARGVRAHPAAGAAGAALRRVATTPARWKPMPWTARRGSFTCTAGRHARLRRAIRTCPSRCAPSANRC